MSTPSPLQSPDALHSASAPTSRMRVTVLTILALHVVFIGGLLMQGCDRKPGSTTTAAGNGSPTAGLPPLGDTNYFSNFPGDGTRTGGGGAPIGTGGSTDTTSTTAAANAGSGSAGIPPVGGSEGSTSLPPLPGQGIGGVSETTGGAGAANPGSASPGAGGLASLPTKTVPNLDSGSAASGTEHVIRSGDKIGDLAKKYGVTAQAIINANPAAKPRNLKVGDRLVIPAPVPVPATTAVASGNSTGSATDGQVYVVKQGDNLSKIAKKFGVSSKALRAANQLKGDRIVPKQRLTIPAKTGAAEASAGNTP